MFKSKMLIICIFHIFLCTVLGQEYKITVYLSPEQVLRFRTVSEICGDQYAVDPKDVLKIMNWTLPHDKAHKQFLHCVLNKNGYIEENGHMNIKETAKIVALNGTMEETLRIYEECDKVSEEDAIETTFALATCYHKHFVMTVKKPED